MPTAAQSTMRISIELICEKRCRGRTAVLGRTGIRPVWNGPVKYLANFVSQFTRCDEIALRGQAMPFTGDLAVKDQRVGALVTRRFGQRDALAIIGLIKVAIDETRLGVAQLGPIEDRFEIGVFLGPAPIAEIRQQTNTAIERS